MRNIFITLVFMLNFTVYWTEGKMKISTGQLLLAQNLNAQQAAAYLNSQNNGNTYTYNSSLNVVYQHNGYGGWPSVIYPGTVTVAGSWTWNGSPTGAGFTTWLNNLSSSVSSAINNFLGSLGSGGSGESGGEEWGGDGWEFSPDGFGFDPTSPDAIDNLLGDPNFNPGYLDPWEQDILNNLSMYEDLYTGNFTIDCANQVNGTAYVGFCGSCSAIASCPDTSLPRIDTVQPMKIICDSVANERGSKLTEIQNGIAALPDKQRLNDSAYSGIYESGISIIKNSPASSYGVINFNTGSASSVNIPTSDPTHTVVAGEHSHPNGKCNSPSPGDIYHLIQGHANNSEYVADFITNAESSDFALMITNTSNVDSFLASYPKDSVVAGDPINDWDSTRIGINKPIANQYKNLLSYLLHNMHYPEEYIQAYANVYILNETLNYSCVKMYKRVNGQFKELNIQKELDASGTLIGLKITVCQ